MVETDAAAVTTEENKEELKGGEVEAKEEAKDAKPKGPDYDGVVKGKYNWDNDTPTQKDADLAGEAITKYSWSDGKKVVSIYVEMEGLDAVADDDLKAESGEKEASLTIAAIGSPAKKRTLKLQNLANEIDGVKLVRKPGKNTVVLKLTKKDADKSWYKLLDSASSAGGGDDDDDPAGGMGGMDMANMMGGMGGMGGMDMASMMGGMGGMGM